MKGLDIAPSHFQTSHLELRQLQVKRQRLQELGQYGFQSGRSAHQNRLETIRDIDKRYGVMIDTHTADGIKVAREHLQVGVPMLVLETALPIKFEETITKHLKDEPGTSPQIQDPRDAKKTWN